MHRLELARVEKGNRERPADLERTSMAELHQLGQAGPVPTPATWFRQRLLSPTLKPMSGTSPGWPMKPKPWPACRWSASHESVTFNLTVKSSPHGFMDFLAVIIIFVLAGVFIWLLTPIPVLIYAAGQILLEPVRYWRIRQYRVGWPP